eukprot:scaffold5017_cov75-Phaeocystis_antarctica.AAC.3
MVTHNRAHRLVHRHTTAYDTLTQKCVCAPQGSPASVGLMGLRAFTIILPSRGKGVGKDGAKQAHGRG